MYKTQYLPQFLPSAITYLFTKTSEGKNENDSAHVMSHRLTTQQNSLFAKGPRLQNELTTEALLENKPFITASLNSYKNSVKTYLIVMQSKGSSTEWNPENFRLCTQMATRTSSRLNQIDSVS